MTGNYWDYPTSTDAEPYSDQPPGSGAPAPSNTANFIKDDIVANGYDDGFAVTGSISLVNSQNYLTDAGAYALAASPYGTFDQGGNVYEWNEASISAPFFRSFRGSSWVNGLSLGLRASIRPNGSPTNELNHIGFRVASIAVPEPSTLLLAALAGLDLLRRRRTPG